MKGKQLVLLTDTNSSYRRLALILDQGYNQKQNHFWVRAFIWRPGHNMVRDRDKGYAVPSKATPHWTKPYKYTNFSIEHDLAVIQKFVKRLPKGCRPTGLDSNLIKI